METEYEKLEYFCKTLGLKTSVLPAKRYAGTIRDKITDRYFVDKFPMFFVPDSSSSPVVTFSFIDAGLLSLTSFESHLFAYQGLFAAVPQVNFLYIGTRSTNLEAARKLFLTMAPRVTNPDPGVEGLHYFHDRYLWESKQYAKLNGAKIEALNKAQERFTDPRIEVLFQPWLQGKVTCDVVMDQFRKLAPKREVSFRTELVDGQAALFEPNLPRPNREQTQTPVTDGSQSTFSPAFNPAFATKSQQAEEN